MVQWLRLCFLMQVGADSIPGGGARIPHASRPQSQNIKQKSYSNKFYKLVKNSPHQKKKSFRKMELIISTLRSSRENQKRSNPVFIRR